MLMMSINSIIARLQFMTYPSTHHGERTGQRPTISRPIADRFGKCRPETISSAVQLNASPIKPPSRDKKLIFLNFQPATADRAESTMLGSNFVSNQPFGELTRDIDKLCKMFGFDG